MRPNIVSPLLVSFGKRAVILALTALFFLQSCAQHANTTPSSPVATAAKVLVDVAAGLQAVQTTVITANGNGVIDAQTTATILNVCRTVNQLGQQASALVRQQSTVPVGLLPLLQMMASDVNIDLQQGLAGIKDQKTLTTIEAVVATIQAGLAAAVVAVGGQ